MNKRFVSLLSIAALALAACGGGQQGGLPGITANSQTALAQFVVHWPSSNGSSLRKPMTISKSAQSISVTVNGASMQVANKPTTGFPTTTTINIDAPVGTDTFAFKAWDQPSAQGNVLDAATVSQLIVANTTNKVSAVLDGQCAGLLIQPTASQPFARTTVSTVNLQNGTTVSLLNSLRMVGINAAKLTVTPVDADGNTIVYSTGAPVIALTESGTTQHVTSTSTTTSGVTTFTLTPVQGEPSSSTTVLTASSPACTPSLTLNNQVTLGVVGAVYVGDTDSIYAFDQDGNLIQSVNTAHPVTGVAWDAINKRVDVVTSTSSTAGKAGLFLYTPALSTIATGTIATTVTLNSLTACNSVGNIQAPPTTEAYQLLMLCPSTNIGTSPGFIHTLTVAVSGTTATTTDDTAAAPAWETGGTSHLYNPRGALQLVGGMVIEADQSTSNVFSGTGVWQAYTYSSGWTDFAQNTSQNSVLGAFNSTSLYVLSANGENYVSSFSTSTSAYKIAVCSANGYLYTFTTSGFVQAYNVQQMQSGTLPNVTLPGAFPNLLAPVQAFATQ